MLLAAFLAAVANLFVTIYGLAVLLVVAQLVVSGETDREFLREAGYYVGLFGGLVSFAFLAFLAAYWAVRRPGRPAFPVHGALVGAVAAAFVAFEHTYVIPPFLPLEMAGYVVLGLAGGLYGGWEGANALAGQEAVVRATRKINEAADPDEIARLIGGYLCRPGVVSVTLWTPELPREESPPQGGSPAVGRPYLMRGAWAASSGDGAGPVAGIPTLGPASSPVLGRLAGHRSGVALPVEELLHGEGELRDSNAFRGARTVLVAPLAARPGDGLLAVATRGRLALKRGVPRDVPAVASTVAVKLDNLRLLETEREYAKLQRDNAVLRERRRFASELHDTLTQGFAAILRNAEAVHLTDGDREDPENRRHLESIEREARENLAEARRLVWALRPEPLEKLTLVGAVAELAREWSARTGVEAHARVAGTPVALPPEFDHALYRVAQEALANVAKHAGGASAVGLTLSYLDGLVVLDVCDDGVGFDPASDTGRKAAGGGFGLGGMRYRIEEEFGGTLLVEAERGAGSTLTAELPLPQEETTRVALTEGRPGQDDRS